MPDYKVRNTKIEAGRYQFNYGRGKQKLQATVWNNDVAGGWQVDANDRSADVVNADAPYRTLKELKAAWGEWATEAYGSDDAEQSYGESRTAPTPPASPGPPPFKRSGPPKHKPSLKQQGPPKRRSGARSELPWPVDGVTDPFDARFRYPSDHENPALRKQHTPLAVVVEVWNALDQMPIDHSPALVTIYRELARVIARECPELKQENGRVQSPAEAAEARQRTRRLDRDALKSAIGGAEADIYSADIPF